MEADDGKETELGLGQRCWWSKVSDVEPGFRLHCEKWGAGFGEIR